MYCTQEDKPRSLQDKEHILHAEVPTLLTTTTKKFLAGKEKQLCFYKSETTASPSCFFGAQNGGL